MPSGYEIIRQLRLDRFELADLVLSEKLLPLNQDTGEPISLDDEKNSFYKIVEITDHGKKTIVVNNPYYIPHSSLKNQPKEFKIPSISPGGKIEMQWQELYKKILKQKKTIEITDLQFKLIENGAWNKGSVQLTSSISHFTYEELEQFSSKISRKEAKENLSEISQLGALTLERLWPEATRQQKQGFNDFKKNLEKNFHKAVRTAVAVIAYCHEQNKKISAEDLQDLLDRPNDFPGAEALEKHKGLPKGFIQDIYTELPPQYRYHRGQKKEANPSKPPEP